MQKYLYSLTYRRDPFERRVHHLSVIARDADEAREMAKLRDPQFLATVRSPQRRAAVTTGAAE